MIDLHVLFILKALLCDETSDIFKTIKKFTNHNVFKNRSNYEIKLIILAFVEFYNNSDNLDFHHFAKFELGKYYDIVESRVNAKKKSLLRDIFRMEL